MIDKIYVVIASANKGQDWILCKALYGGILGAEFQKQARDMLEELYQDIKKHGKRIPRKYFKIVEYSDNAELLKQIERLQEENATLKSNLGECEVNYSAALHYAREDNKKLQAENTALRERLDKEEVEKGKLKPYVEQDNNGYYRVYCAEYMLEYIIDRICRTQEAAEARLKELQEGEHI